MGIPNVVYPLFIGPFVALQISYERSNSINATRDSVNEFAIVESRVSQCPADRLRGELLILSLVIGIKRVPIFVNNVVDVVDINLSNHEHEDAHDRTNDGHDNNNGLDNDGQNVEHGFHNDTSKYLFLKYPEAFLPSYFTNMIYGQI